MDQNEKRLVNLNQENTELTQELKKQSIKNTHKRQNPYDLPKDL